MFQSVNSYFGLLGGIMGSIMALLLPCACYAKVEERLSGIDYVVISLMVFISIVAMIGGVLSVADPV